MCPSKMSAPGWHWCSHPQQLSSHSQEEISLKPAILLWGLQSQGKREWGVRNSWDSACATYKQELMSSKLNFHAALWYISLLSPSPLFSLYLPAPPILLSYSKQYIFWLPLAPQICQEVSYWDLLEPLQLQLLGCWMLYSTRKHWDE